MMPFRLLLLNCLACLWCCLVLGVRISLTGHPYYVFLVWNLFLAAIPLGLSGFGVYLGRFLRWNSWDVVHQPHLLLGDILARVTNPVQHFQTWSFTAGFGILLMLAYLFWVSAMHAPGMRAGPDRA